MTRTGFAVLEFKSKFNSSKKKKLRDGLSGVLQIGNTLWVANDETITLERLSYQGTDADGIYRYGDHLQFALSDYLQLPVPPAADPKEIEEADLEGLVYHNDYLWLIGSHSLKRKKPDPKKSLKENLQRLEKVNSDGNRLLLARIPLVQENGSYTLKRTALSNGKRLTAAQLRGDDKSNDLMDAVRRDKHLQDFVALPGKDNGVDFEGLAAVGNRLFIGLRGPVLRGWCMILEVEPEEDSDHSSTLRLNKIGPDDLPYRKHFLQLGGLGIRDLCVQGSDLLILAGPTMDLDGPVTIFRWPKGTAPKGESMVFEESLTAALEVPYGQGNNKGKDHAEGMTLFSQEGKANGSVLVVYDSAAQDRRQGENGVEADIFSL